MSARQYATIAPRNSSGMFDWVGGGDASLFSGDRICWSSATSLFAFWVGGGVVAEGVAVAASVFHWAALHV